MHDSSNLRYVLSKNVVTESPSVLTCVCVRAYLCDELVLQESKGTGVCVGIKVQMRNEDLQKHRGGNRQDRGMQESVPSWSQKRV